MFKPSIDLQSPMIASLGREYAAPFVSLLKQVCEGFEQDLLRISPSTYSSNDKFVAEWTKRRISIELINDLILLIEKETNNAQ